MQDLIRFSGPKYPDSTRSATFRIKGYKVHLISSVREVALSIRKVALFMPLGPLFIRWVPFLCGIHRYFFYAVSTSFYAVKVPPLLNGRYLFMRYRFLFYAVSTSFYTVQVPLLCGIGIRYRYLFQFGRYR